MKEHGKSLSLHYIVDDFIDLSKTKSFLSQNSKGTRIYGLLGGALGNFKEGLVLGAIKSLMRPKDFLLLGVEYIAGRKTDELKKNYQGRKMKEFLLGPILDVKRELSPNWNDPNLFHYDVIESEDNTAYSDVSKSLTVTGQAEYHSQRNNLFYSTKYDKDQLEIFLKDIMKFRILDKGVFVSPESPPVYGKYILKLGK